MAGWNLHCKKDCFADNVTLIGSNVEELTTVVKCVVDHMCMAWKSHSVTVIARENTLEWNCK